MASINETSENEAHSSDSSEEAAGDMSSFIEINEAHASSSEDEAGSGVDDEPESEIEWIEEDIAVDEPMVEQREKDLKAKQELSAEEIELIRMQLRSKLNPKKKSATASSRKSKKEVFRVPKEHPVFVGETDQLEAFIVEMELTHSKETTGRNADRHHPEFITKLVPYFKEGTAARIWFKMYASRRSKANKKLTWKRLVRDLRLNYGAFDQPDIQFEDYYDMMQGSMDVKTYIAKKCEAALMSDDLTPRLLKFGFIRGLKSDICNYVKLQKPDSLEDAQRIAIDFENSMKKSSSSKKQPSVSDNGKKKDKRDGDKQEGHRKRPRESADKMSESQKKALDELRKLRKNKCFGCGLDGHRREECKTDKAIVKKHLERVAELRQKINGK